MLIAQGHRATDRLRHYGVKCDEHLSRVRLSHVLASAGLRAESARLESGINDLVRVSFGDMHLDLQDLKLRQGLNEVHLIALKADFELYLNRVLTVVWTAHFASLAENASGKRDVSLREVADAAAHGTSGRDFVIERIVPVHGLTALVGSLTDATDIQLPGNLRDLEFSQWSQIQVAFEVRHLVEHRDGQVDSDFQEHVEKFWSNSSWGRRRTRVPGLLKKIRVEEVDVESTYDAMRHAVRLLTDALVEWDSRQPITNSAESGDKGSSESAE